MIKTKIDWTDSSWNPVTGCLHQCTYCYARKIAQRFDGKHNPIDYCDTYKDNPLYELLENKQGAYPYGFNPTFHRYRLGDYKDKKGRTIFVGSMTDLFGDWVPDEWIEEVFKACAAAPQHRYLFLTKNPQRYYEMQETIYDLVGWQYSPEAWFGMTITGIDNTFSSSLNEKVKCFLSIEPLLQEINWIDLSGIGWVIVGSETGHRKGKVIPKREWIEKIVDECRTYKIPVFMKSSLTDIWSEPLLQEFPWRTENEKEI